MSQAKIGKPDFYPMTQKIEEVSIFFPTITVDIQVVFSNTSLSTDGVVGWVVGSVQ